MKINGDHINNEDSFLKIIQNVPVGIVLFSGDWKINFINENFYQFGTLYDINTSDLIGSNILEYKFFSSVDISDQIKNLESGYSFETEVTSITARDGRISVIVKGAPLYEENNFTGGILIIEDLKVSDKETDEDQLIIEHFESAINKSNDVLFITDISGNIKNSYGKYATKIIQGKDEKNNVSEIFKLNVNTEFAAKLKSAVEKKIAEKCGLDLILDEDVFHYNCIIHPILNKTDDVQFVYIWLRNISDFVKKEKQLQKEVNKLKQYEAIIETSADAVFTLDEEGSIIFWSRSAHKMFGFSFEETAGEFAGKLFKDINQDLFNKIKKEIKDSAVKEYEFEAYTKDETKKYFSLKFTFTGDIDNSISVLCRDITERSVQEKEIRNSEEKLRNIFNVIDKPLLILNSEGYIIESNEEFISRLNYSIEEITDKNIRNFIQPEYLRNQNLNLKSLINSVKTKIPFLGKAGELIIFATDFSPVYKNNQLEYINCILDDVTEEENYSEEIGFLNTLFQSSPDGFAVEFNGKIIQANKTFANIFGHDDPEDVINKEILDFCESSDVVKCAEFLRLVDQKKNNINRLEITGKRKDNSLFSAEISASVFDIGNSHYTVLIVRDITERKIAQNLIRESEEKYRNITENIDDFLYAYERVNNLLKPVFCTSSSVKITGFTQNEFINDSKLIVKIIHPDDLPEVKKKIKQLFKSRVKISEEFEFRIINKHGNIVWVRNKINTVRSGDGGIIKVYGLMSDISLRKKTEEDLLTTTENLVKLNETKDKFISIVSHDLRTPFSSILGFTDLLLHDEELTEADKSQYVQYIRDSSKSMLSLVNSLLDWTRLQTGRIKFDLEKTEASLIIKKSFNALSGSAFQKNIELISNVGDDISVFVDEELIGQVFNNLITNAIKFTNPGGKITISASPSESLRFIEFSVRDNGVGIREENLQYLFKVESKFSSEGTSGERGSGLGLSLVKEIVEKHGGKIWVETEYGKGSDFRFNLPVASAEILLVDDSQTDRLLYAKILKNITSDYNIEVVSNGKEALEKIKTSPPALIITDHVMPEMNGYELVQEIKKSNLKSKPPVIILSSDINRNEIQEYNQIGVEFVFQKPVNLSVFKQAVEKSLKKSLTIS